MAPISRLHALKRCYPAIDVSAHLLKISAAFRRFVLDSLVRLDELQPAETEKETNVSHNIISNSGSNSNNSGNTVASLQPTAAAASSPNENINIPNKHHGNLNPNLNVSDVTDKWGVAKLRPVLGNEIRHNAATGSGTEALRILVRGKGSEEKLVMVVDNLFDCEI